MKLSCGAIFVILLFFSVKLRAYEFYGSIEDEVLQCNLNESSLLNPGNRYLDSKDWNNIARVRLNVSKKLDKSEKFSMNFKTFSEYGKFQGEDNKKETFRFDENYLDWEANSSLYFLMGKKRITWGVGFFFNPVDFINPSKDAKNPVFQQEGTLMFLAEHLDEKFSLDVMGIPNYNGDYYSNRNKLAIKLRLNPSLYDFDFYYLGGNSFSNEYGFSYSVVYPNDFGMFGEAAYVKENQKNYYRILDIEKKDKYIGKALIGFNWTYKLNNKIQLEYFNNGSGYDKNEREAYFDYLNAATDYKTGELNQNYLMLSLSKREVKNVYDFELRAIYAVDDKSYMLTPSVDYRINDFFTIKLEDSIMNGSGDSEFGNNVYAGILKMTVAYNF